MVEPAQPLQMYINLPETGFRCMERLLTAVRWIPSRGIVSAQVVDRGDGFQLWIDAVNILSKQGFFFFFFFVGGDFCKI
jgi:hypothetical protein